MMSDLTPVQRLKEAIQRLETLKDTSTPRPWESCEDDLTNEVDVWHDHEHRSHVAACGVAGMTHVLADAELIVTLHRTIDAQLAILHRELSFAQQYGWPSNPFPERLDVLALADAINAGVSQ
jgi:hypothetical protein